jgi:hypothetical protein
VNHAGPSSQGKYRDWTRSLVVRATLTTRWASSGSNGRTTRLQRQRFLKRHRGRRAEAPLLRVLRGLDKRWTEKKLVCPP